MGALEGLSGQLACQRITDSQIAEIKAMQYEMRAAHARRDLHGYYKINHAIHNWINTVANNAVLTETYLQINARIQSLRFRSNFNQEKWDAAIKEHDEMVIALEKRDGEKMRAILEQHLLNKRNAVVADLRSKLSA
jgi:DNA-binding GntR family transcriptional regulator